MTHCNGDMDGLYAAHSSVHPVIVSPQLVLTAIPARDFEYGAYAFSKASCAISAKLQKASSSRTNSFTGLGVDTASIDYGQSDDFIVHRIAAERNVIGLENLTSLDALPPKGAWILALPIKIAGGSGGPARVVAMLP